MTAWTVVRSRCASACALAYNVAGSRTQTGTDASVGSTRGRPTRLRMVLLASMAFHHHRSSCDVSDLSKERGAGEGTES